MKTFAELLVESVAFHGHLCPGQVLGVRMALLGCRGVGVEEPRGSKQLVAYVEIDRCATDAIQSVTGCKLGRRTLKYVDYGKMAATFLNTETGRALRVVARDDSRERAWAYAPTSSARQEAQLQAYMRMPDEELFVVSPVRLQIPEEDMPGHPVGRVECDSCGEGINDRREVALNGRTLCRACAHGGYYQAAALELPGIGMPQRATSDQ